MPFWLALKAAGARPIGLREQLHQDFEEGVPSFPLDYVDTQSYRSDALARQAEMQSTYEKKPPSKRPNFDKLSVDHPFLPDWSSLLESRSSASDDGEAAHTAIPVPIRQPWFKDGDVVVAQVHFHSGRGKLHAQIYPCSKLEAEHWRTEIKMFDPEEQADPLGFLTTCDEYSYTRGYGFGLAVVRRSAFFGDANLTVFVRNPTSQHCHLATLVPLRSHLF